jgi:hypothetical protein
MSENPLSDSPNSSVPAETVSTSTSASAQPIPVNTEPPTAFEIGEEFGTAKKNLPPAGIVAICLGVLVVIIAVVGFTQRPHASATGSIDDVTAVEIPGQNSVLVAINISFHNNSEKPFWVHSMKADLSAQTGEYSDEAASSVDFDRYFQAFPPLKAHALTPLKMEDKIQPGAQMKGTMIVSFPVTPDVFNNRKSLKVTIWPYDQAVPMVLTK